MRTILINEIYNEKPNSSALGGFNSAVQSQVSGVNINTVTQTQIDSQKSFNKGFPDKVAQRATEIIQKKLNDSKKPFASTKVEGNFQFEKIKGTIYKRDNSTGNITKDSKAKDFTMPNINARSKKTK